MVEVLTVRVSGLDGPLGAKLALPPYAAVMVCWPTERVEGLSVASSTPFTTASATGVCACPSIVNVTSPPGVPDPVVVTAAVKVTAWPNVTTLAGDVTWVVVLGSGEAFTTCVKVWGGPARKSPVGV